MTYLMDTIRPFVEVSAAHGSVLTLRDGNEVVDFFCDVGTASLGYSTGRQLAHVPNLYRLSLREEAAKRLCLASGMDKVFFSTSGTEAVEASIKLARRFQSPQRRTILSESGGFHGRTYAALAAGDGPPHHTQGFGPLPECFAHARIGKDTWRRVTDRTCAVLISPINGNNDVIVHDVDHLRSIQKACQDTGAVLIFDEVQTGAGRASSGNVTYAQGVGLEPDVVCLGKGVAAGIPCGVTLARGEVANAFAPGTHFSTFGGSPTAMTGVLDMLKFLATNPRSADRVGDAVVSSVATYATNVRGQGALIAFDLDVDRVEFANACLEEGVLVPSFRAGPGALKVTPPLNIGAEELIHGLDAMAKAYWRTKREIRR